MVQAHEIRLVQLFQNLIGNAIKYQRREAASNPCERGAPGRDDWLFAVEDNGIGIKPEYAQQIFGIFKRLHGTTTREPGSASPFVSGLSRDTAAGSGWNRRRDKVPGSASRFQGIRCGEIPNQKGRAKRTRRRAVPPKPPNFRSRTGPARFLSSPRKIRRTRSCPRGL